MDVRLLAYHRVVFVVGVVGVAQLTVRPELELQELVAELALMADVVAYVEVRRHPADRRSTRYRSSVKPFDFLPGDVLPPDSRLGVAARHRANTKPASHAANLISCDIMKSSFDERDAIGYGRSDVLHSVSTNVD